MLEAARHPRDRGELTERLRDGRFPSQRYCGCPPVVTYVESCSRGRRPRWRPCRTGRPWRACSATTRSCGTRRRHAINGSSGGPHAPFGFTSACRPPPQPRGAMASSVLSAPGWPSVAAGAARALVVLGDDELPSCLRPIPGLARHAQQEDLMRTEVEVLNNDPPPRLGCFGKVLSRLRATAH